MRKSSTICIAASSSLNGAIIVSLDDIYPDIRRLLKSDTVEAANGDTAFTNGSIVLSPRSVTMVLSGINQLCYH